MKLKKGGFERKSRLLRLELNQLFFAWVDIFINFFNYYSFYRYLSTENCGYKRPWNILGQIYDNRCIMEYKLLLADLTD